MKTRIEGGVAFSHVHVELEPGERLFAESDAMSTMSADLDMTARLNGGLFSAFAKRFLGDESLFINEFQNNAGSARHLTISQGTPGEVREMELTDSAICLQPGAYLASTPGLKLGVRWAGFRSFIAREGLFKLLVRGTGTLWYGAYGGLVDKEVDGEYIVDSGHLVAYDPSIQLRIQLAGGIFSSFFGGEGLVARLVGKGRVVLQSRSLSGLKAWLNPHLV